MTQQESQARGNEGATQRELPLGCRQSKSYMGKYGCGWGSVDALNVMDACDCMHYME